MVVAFLCRCQVHVLPVRLHRVLLLLCHLEVEFRGLSRTVALDSLVLHNRYSGINGF
jgi:hypothetical protein